MTEFQSLPKPKPRQISDGSLEGLQLVLCAVWILGSALMVVIFLVGTGPDWFQYWQLRRSGTVTQGELLRRDVGPEWASHIFTFTVDDDSYTGSQSIRTGDVDPNLTVGTITSVRYFVENPQVAVIESYFSPPTKTPLLFGVMGSLMMGLGLVLLPRRYQAWFDIRRLRAGGETAMAVVVNRWRTATSNQRLICCVAYEFEMTYPDGRQEKIVAAEINELAYDLLRLHQSTPVRYLAENPQTCCLETASLIERHVAQRQASA